ncbi:MAG TPA: hemolysin family protein [bacterium]
MEIIIIALLILLNGLFALAEIAFVASSESRLREIAFDQGNKKAQQVLELRKDPDKFLSTIQVSITLIGVIAGAYSGLTLAGALSRLIVHIPVAFISHYAYLISLVLLVLVVTYFTIVFGELIPKTFALRNAEMLIIRLVNIIRVFSILLYPFVAILSFSIKLFFKIAGIPKTAKDQELDMVKQILGATRVAVIEHKIEKEQEKIIKNAIRINQIKVHEIMVPKENIKYLYSDMSLLDALLEAHVHQHTRYPVLDKKTNETIGYINFKDIINVLKFNPREPSLLSICRPLIKFNDQEYIVAALKTMIRNFQHIGLVTDAKKETTELGLITQEDIIEVLVGDISGELDLMPDYLYKIARDRYIAGGKIKLSELNSKVSSSIPVSTPDQDISLNDWLQEQLDHNVKTDSRVRANGVQFIIKKLRHSQIHEVIIDLSK